MGCPAVRVSHEGGREKEVRRRLIAGDRGIAYDGDSQQGLHVDVVGHRFERTPEKHYEIDAAFDDGCTDMEVAAEGPTGEAVYREIQLLRQEASGGTGGEQPMFGQDTPIAVGPVQEIPFPIIMGDERDVLSRRQPWCRRLLVRG